MTNEDVNVLDLTHVNPQLEPVALRIVETIIMEQPTVGQITKESVKDALKDSWRTTKAVAKTTTLATAVSTIAMSKGSSVALQYSAEKLNRASVSMVNFVTKKWGK